jgi:hypothetical protein
MPRIEAGGLVFEVENRTFGGDGEPALMVFGDADGKQVQVLRFDCFRNGPHYHYDPSGKNDVHQLEKGADNVGWTIGQVRTRLPDMIRTAGYSTLANRVDMGAVLAAVAKVEQALRSA